MLKKKTIAVVVPAYNEEEQIGMVIESMPEYVDRIIIVNDFSKDNTAKVVERYIKEDKSEVRDLNHRKKIVPSKYNNAEVVLRTPNPIIATNQPPVTPKTIAGQEWPNSSVKEVAEKIVTLGKEMDIIVVDHYKSWIQADASHAEPAVSNPNKLWLRMSDSFHPNSLGHLAFYRDLAPYFGLPQNLSWEF